jgi:protocatechuate 3,4-dioxygenase alpha subunit
MKRERLAALPSQTIGPFYHFSLTGKPQLGCMVRPETAGQRIRIRFCVLDGDGLPVSDSMLELWQADAAGKYDHPADTQETLADPAFCGFGRLSTDAEGVCTFHTVYPGRVPDGRGGC